MGCNNQPQQVLQELQIKPTLSILHFNDVYDIQTKKGTGGVCNFKAKLDELRANYGENCLVLFSGDAFSPSILSRNKQGWQMVKALNALNIDAACYGNHEFDFSEDHTIKLAQANNFPWLLGNIKHIKTQRILGNGIPYITKTMPNGLKVGIFGVAGQDWISIMSEEYEGLFECEDVEEYCMNMSKKLKEEEKCDFIIALTHMRNGDDLDLAEVPSEIDIILGGHDHVIMNRCVESIPVIKSGSNFHQVGVVQIYKKLPQFENEQNVQETQHNHKNQYVRKFYVGKSFDFSCQIHDVPIAPPEKVDAQLKAYVDKEVEEYKKVDRIVGYTQCPLQARFRVIRTQESNYGNFFADLFRNYYDSDIGFANSGCIRNDAVLPEGPIKLSKMSNVIDDKIIVKLLPGIAIIKMLEYAVKGLPHSFMGSFLLVSGIKYTYDLSKQPRIQSVQWNGEPLNQNRQYTVAMPSYMGNGADGYDFIKQYRKVVDEVRAISILNVLFLFFEGLDEKKEDHDSNHDYNYHPKRSEAKRVERIKSLRTKFTVTENGEKFVCICPKIDSRILCVNEAQNS